MTNLRTAKIIVNIAFSAYCFYTVVDLYNTIIL